ncbi:MAG: ATP-grasp domain-containing protein [Actinomycetota bacterium]|nr:ATP-grasp domain-containing protein [Actinomycetota bacterium]
MAGRRPDRTLACVVGGVEVVRALGAAGIRSVVVGPPDAPARLSRFAAAGIDLGPGALVDALVAHARAQAEPPVLLFDSDAVLLEVSRARDRLAGHFRLLLPAPELVEDLVDKGRFQDLAERLALDVPEARRVATDRADASDLVGLGFPLILKPVPYRDERWDALGERAKALYVEDAAELRRLWPRLAEAGLELLAQQIVPGSEAEILSYHVYVDRAGDIAGEFTGRKIRTYPARFGVSSALVTTRDEQVSGQGRDVVRRLGIVGPAKLDFKRDPDGRLALLEVNPRLTLWAQAGAVAGVNLPAIAHADLTGAPRPAAGPARAGVRWIHPRLDLAAAREVGLSLPRWATFALRCETNQALAWNDPWEAWRRYGPPRRSRSRAVAG